MKSSERIAYSRIIFITGIVLLSTLSILFIYETYQEYTSSSVIYNTKNTRLILEKTFSLLKEREARLLHQLTTQRPALVSLPFTDSLNHQLKAVDSLLADTPLEKSNVLALQKLSASLIKHQSAIVNQLIERGYFRSDQMVNDFNTVRVKSDSIRALINVMQQSADIVLRSRSLEAQKHTIIATMMGVTLSIFSIIVFILAFYFIDQELRRSQNYLDETQTLNIKIGEINKEVAEANKNLLQLNTELEGKNFQLEKYAAELSSFTHITSHDMQEPLRKIEFYISIVDEREKEKLSEEGKKYLEKIRKSVTRMRKLFLGMLDFSLTNTTKNNVEDVNLNDVLDQTLNSLKVYIKDTNLVIENDPLPTIKAVRYQLIQLFENIISNAIKFRKAEIEPEIRILCQQFISTDQPIRGLRKSLLYHKIDFIDNGIGFEPQYSERIFEMFQRLIPKGDAHGLGMGLAICRKIAENHGGTLVASSQPEQGSVFSLYIPASPKIKE
jgi:signal transduction histidine kinase